MAENPTEGRGTAVLELGPILRSMRRNKVRFGLIVLEIALTLAIVANCVTMIVDARKQDGAALGLRRREHRLGAQHPVRSRVQAKTATSTTRSSRTSRRCARCPACGPSPTRASCPGRAAAARRMLGRGSEGRDAAHADLQRRRRLHRSPGDAHHRGPRLHPRGRRARHARLRALDERPARGGPGRHAAREVHAGRRDHRRPTRSWCSASRRPSSASCWRTRTATSTGSSASSTRSTTRTAGRSTSTSSSTRSTRAASTAGRTFLVRTEPGRATRS